MDLYLANQTFKYSITVYLFLTILQYSISKITTFGNLNLGEFINVSHLKQYHDTGNVGEPYAKRNFYVHNTNTTACVD